jgi:hypothetical protein
VKVANDGPPTELSFSTHNPHGTALYERMGNGYRGTEPGELTGHLTRRIIVPNQPIGRVWNKEEDRQCNGALASIEAATRFGGSDRRPVCLVRGFAMPIYGAVPLPSRLGETFCAMPDCSARNGG